MQEQPTGPRTPDVDVDLPGVLDALVRVVERKSTEFRASILLLSSDGKRVLDAAGPSLPHDYRRAIHGLEIGPAAGSCGTAAYRNARVIVTDIETDPLWEPFRDLARPFGLAACWSQPIRSAAGDVLGTFAMYYSEPRSPNPSDIQLIEAAAVRAGELIERSRAGAPPEQLIAELT
jgi:GAF domain-containing protein